MLRGQIILLMAVCLASCASLAQGSPALAGLHRDIAKVSAPFNLPDAPSAMIEPNAEYQPKRELLARDPYQPLTRHEKWEHFLRRTYAPATFLGAAEDTVFTRATGGFIYCCGIGGWGEQYAATVADKESRQFFGDYLFPTLLKQDPRYFPKRRGGVWGRAWYATTRVLVTRNDNGNAAFNYSEILGVAFAKATSNLYYPDRQRGGWETANRILGTFQSDAASNIISEFWPEMRSVLKHCTPKSLRRVLPDEASQY